MTTIHQEIVLNSEHEAEEVDSSQECSCEATKELFRREASPLKIIEVTTSPATAETPPTKSESPISLCLTPNKPPIKSTVTKKDSTQRKKSNSGIPLRLKTSATPKHGKTYTRHTPQMGSFINKNTLEVQFLNNKKRLMQMHAELIDKQRPLLEMHKSLQRTKKQLEELGKKVTLEDLKIVSLKTEDVRNMEGAGENPIAETAIGLKSSIDNVLDSCVKICKKCFVERDHVVKMLENAWRAAIDPSEIESEVQELRKEKDTLEKSVEKSLKESEKKIDEMLNDWQKSVKSKSFSAEMDMKISELQDTIKHQQKSLQDAEDNLHSLTRRHEDKRVTLEKTISELQEKVNKMDEELKKEKKYANENLMKTRSFRSKVTDLEAKVKDAEERCADTAQKLKQVQEQSRKKEIQWMKEKDDLKKNELILQQKFSEKQSQFDTRLKDMEKLQKNVEIQQHNFCRNFETQLEIKDQEFQLMEKERDSLAEKSKVLEDQVDELKKQLEEKEKEIEDLSMKVDSVPAIEYKPSESHWMELMEYKQKLTECQNHIEQLNEQIAKMQSSLKAHAKLAAALKLEKDNAVKYSNKLRDVLQEVKEELDYKNKTIYKIHEKLVLKEKAFEKLKAQMKDYETCSEYPGDKWDKNRCQICMTSMGEKTENSSCIEAEVGKSYINSPQYVSESLIGMSVKKVDHLRARLDNLKKMKLPSNTGSKQLNVNYSWSHHAAESKNKLRKQIELRGKLYQILQKHADQSCEDFINLLKLTVSTGGRATQSHDELKPSNMKNVDDAINNFTSRKHLSNLKMSESFNPVPEYFGPIPLCDLCSQFHDSVNSETEDNIY